MDGAHHIARDPRTWRLAGHGERMTVIVAYAAFGITLLVQPGRYSNTPSYANLLDVLPAWTWGVLYLVAGLGLLVPLHSKGISAAMHTAASGLTAVWLAAFLIRYFTDSGTTIVNVVSWSVFLTLVIRSALVDQGAL